ncbi:hypothetical protein HRbin27_01583 [bacterium HR27]|nr:hypothetical protein HRbin27_01583 [bacterium HR27]
MSARRERTQPRHERASLQQAVKAHEKEDERLDERFDGGEHERNSFTAEALGKRLSSGIETTQHSTRVDDDLTDTDLGSARQPLLDRLDDVRDETHERLHLLTERRCDEDTSQHE